MDNNVSNIINNSKIPQLITEVVKNPGNLSESFAKTYAPKAPRNEPSKDYKVAPRGMKKGRRPKRVMGKTSTSGAKKKRKKRTYRR
jgi:hypothetical protein